MKYLFLLPLFISAISFSQEYDDMYFNRKDREHQYEMGKQIKSTPKREQISRFNPTDSYSTRNVNPDNIQSISTNGSTTIMEDDYLPEEYAYGYRSAYQTKNTSYNSGFYGPRFSTWNSPYFGMSGIYDPWMLGNPYFMSSNMMFRHSNIFWRNSFMMDPFNSWYNPYYNMSMWHNDYYNNFWGRNNWGHTTVVIVGDNYNSHISRTRRPSRGGSFNSTEYNNTNVRSRDNNNVVSNNMNRQNNTGRYDNTRNTTVNRYDSRQATTTRSNINTYQSRTSNTGVAPSSRQRVQSYSPVQQNNTRSYSPSSSNVGGMRSTGGNNSMGGSVGSSRSNGSSVGSSSSGGSRSRGGN